MKHHHCFYIAFLLLLFLSDFLIAQENRHIFDLIKKAGERDDYSTSDILVIFDSTKVDVKESGLSYVTNRTLTKILTPKGAKEMRTVKFYYDTLSAYIEITEANIYKKDGRVIRLSEENFYDYQTPARGIYWGGRDRMVALGFLEVGDAVEVKLFRKGFTYALLYDDEEEKYIPPMRGHFYDIVEFWSTCPVLDKYYETKLPKDKPLQYEVYNGQLRSGILFGKEKNTYFWCKKDIEPFKREPGMVAISDEAPKLLLSTAPNWESKSIWFYNVNEDYGSFEVTPEIKEKVDEIVEGTKSDIEKISRLTHWAAEEIRYSGLSMGPGEGYTLHKGNMTFRDRCGVCKDKAGILVTLLRAAGFESYAAMTMAGSRIERIPADQFNHSVTLVKYRDEYMLLDPTWVPGVRELWSSAEQQQQYLMGVPEGADLMTTPIAPPEEHFYRVKGESELHLDGTLEGEFILWAEKQSDAQIRRVLRRSYQNTWKPFFEEMMYHISPNVEIIELKYQDPYDLSKPMKIEIEYRIPEYALVSENEIHFVPVVATYPFWDRTINHHLFMNLDLEERNYGFRTTCTRLVELEEVITLPKSLDVGIIPEYDEVDGTGASFKANYETEGNKLVFKEELVLKKRIYEPEDWSSFRASVKSAIELTKDPVILFGEGR